MPVNKKNPNKIILCTKSKFSWTKSTTTKYRKAMMATADQNEQTSKKEFSSFGTQCFNVPSIQVFYCDRDTSPHSSLI